MIQSDDKVAVWGISGSGKTTLGMGLIEHLRDRCRFAIIDPYATKGFRTAKGAAEALYRGDKVAVLQNANPEAAIPFIYAACFASTKKNPVFLVCDEAPDYLDKEGSNLKRVFTQGRHRGLGIMVMGQRPSMVLTTYRTQCRKSRWLQLVDHSDVEVARKLIGPENAAKLKTFTAGQNISHPPENPT